MKDFTLTEEYLMQVGIYEETYDLYVKLIGIYDAAYSGFCEVINARNEKLPIELDKKLDEIARKESRKEIEDYLAEYTYVFTDRYPRLHTSAKTMTRFSMLDYKWVKYTKHIWQVSFNTFLKRFFDLIVRIISNRIRYEKPLTSDERILSEIEKYMANALVMANQDRYSLSKDNAVSDRNELFVFRSLSSISCNINKHNVVPKLFVTKTIENETPILIPIHYCETCGRSFIGLQTFNTFEKKHGKFYAKKNKEELYTSDSNFFINLNVESKLHSLGYNVIVGELSEKERRHILIYLLENKKISYFEIHRDITNSINIFKNVETHQLAVEKWKSDLDFIDSYVKSKLE